MPIKIEGFDKDLSANAGLILYNRLFEKTNISDSLSSAVPALKGGVGRSLHKAKQIVLGLVSGADCLDDYDRLAHDGGFKAICDEKVYSAKSCGDFLRSFNRLQIRTLNQKLVDNGFAMREAVIGKTESFTIDLDSTSNPQYGKKMEGVVTNYKGIDCLDTIHAFDEYGIQYWNDVRPGSTNTATGSLEIIHEIFKKFPATEDFKHMRKYFRADRGYCNIGILNACAAKGVGFVIGLRQLMMNPLINRVNEWHREDPRKKDRIIFKGGRECEIGETVYQPKNSPHIFRVVIIRAPKNGRERQIVFGKDDYDYFGWVTSIGSNEMSARKVIHFYRKRGNAENYIKDVKLGLDMQHYPCQKLNANRAYALLGAFAYNMMRYFALSADKKSPQQAKAIRFRFVHLPCQVVRHAGEVVFRFMQKHLREVDYWLKRIEKLQLRFQ